MTTKFVEVVSTTQTATTIGRDLASCQTIADLFDNTCDNTQGPIDFSTHAGETMSCVGQMMCPLGDGSKSYTESDPCTFQRQLCVTCETQNNEVYIRVQTN